MKLIKYSLVIILGLASFNVLAEPPLTETSISNMLQTMENAVTERDVESLMDHFTEDAKITLDMPEDLGGKMELGVVEYKNMLKQSWAMPVKFTYEVQELVVTVAPNGKSAIATDLTIETIEVDGKVVMSTKTREQVTIKSFNGIPKITNLYGKFES